MTRYVVYGRLWDDRYTLSRTQALGMSEGRFRIDVAGPKEPDLPKEPVEYHGLVEWQYGLIQAGFRLLGMSRC